MIVSVYSRASSSTAAREMALSLVGQVCCEVFHGENKRKTERKLFIREHQLKCCFLFSASLSSLPSSRVSFIYFIALFSHSVSFSHSLYLSRSLSSFFSRSPLSAAVTDFFLPRLKYEYFRAKKLKGNNEMAPQVKLYSISRVTEEGLFWVMSAPVPRGCVFLFFHTHISLLSPAFMSYLWYSPRSCFWNC